jgi:SPP1 family phage portal protein
VFHLPKDAELTLDLLEELLREHDKEVSRFKKLREAYESKHEILNAPKKPHYKPDNRIVVNFPKYILDTFEGFFIGNPIKTVAEEYAVAEYVEHLEKYNDQDDNNAEVSKLGSMFGKGYELYFTDEESEQAITYMSPEVSFMVYDDSIVEVPLFFVRRWTDRDNNEYGCAYDRSGYRNFIATGGLRWTDEDWVPHYYVGVPATEFMQNEERMGVYEPILSMSNAYNKAISEKANDVDYFSDAYLKILGVDLDEESVKHIRDNRIINFLGEDAEKLVVEFMGKPEGDTTQENLLERLERLIYQISMVANISDENFGTSSGIAMKYKLQAMSNLAKTKQRKFTSGMNRRYKLLFSHPASKVPADAWMGLEYQFTMNIPANLLEEAQIAAQMEGITSHETQLKVLSIVDNVQDELDKIEEENKANEESIVDKMMFGDVANDATTETEEEVIDDEQP